MLKRGYTSVNCENYRFIVLSPDNSFETFTLVLLLDNMKFFVHDKVKQCIN